MQFCNVEWKQLYGNSEATELHILFVWSVSDSHEGEVSVTFGWDPAQPDTRTKQHDDSTDSSVCFSSVTKDLVTYLEGFMSFPSHTV